MPKFSLIYWRTGVSIEVVIHWHGHLFTFLRVGARVARTLWKVSHRSLDCVAVACLPAAALTWRNLVSGMRKLILRWHSLHMAKQLSPRTPTTPGAAYDVEHSEHVGMKLL